jgi:hypothetical protein
LENVDIFYGHLEYFYRHLGYFMTTWYILCSFGTFFPVLVSCTKKILATLFRNKVVVKLGPEFHVAKSMAGFNDVLLVTNILNNNLQWSPRHSVVALWSSHPVQSCVKWLFTQNIKFGQRTQNLSDWILILFLEHYIAIFISGLCVYLRKKCLKYNFFASLSHLNK